jgi:hypothetical protein
MTESQTRMKRLRETRKRQGEKAVEVWLDPPSQVRLERVRQPGESVSAVIRRALTTLMDEEIREEGNGNEPVTSDMVQEKPSVTSAQSIITSDSMNPLQRKAALLARLRAMKAAGLSLQAIATQLNVEGVPTISGKGQWQKGTVSNLLAQGPGEP